MEKIKAWVRIYLTNFYRFSIMDMAKKTIRKKGIAVGDYRFIQIQSTEKTRKSNFELLRIICMALIVMHHLAVHSNITGEVSKFNSLFLNMFTAVGKIAVNVYVLISGYFLINGKFNFSKFINLVLEAVFFSVLLYFASCKVDLKEFKYEDLIYCVFPISTRRYWFMQMYVFLYMLSPFLNKLLKKIGETEYLIMLLALLFIQVQMPYSNNSFFTDTLLSRYQIAELLWFITLYAIAGYIRLYPSAVFNKKRIAIPLLVFSFYIIILGNYKLKVAWFDMRNVLVLISSLSLFCTFKNIKMKSNKVINFISALFQQAR